MNIGHAGTHGMILIQFVAHIELNAIGIIGTQGIRCRAKVNQIGDWVRRVMQIRVLMEIGCLKIQITQALLIRQHQKPVHFGLIFIDLRRGYRTKSRAGIAVPCQRVLW